MSPAVEETVRATRGRPVVADLDAWGRDGWIVVEELRSPGRFGGRRLVVLRRVKPNDVREYRCTEEQRG